LDAARADITRLTQAPAATLAVGLTPLAGALPAVAQSLAALRQQLPRLDMTVRLGPRSLITTAVARGQLDIALIDGLAAPGDSLPLPPPLSGTGITESEVSLILPPDHPLAHRPTLRLPDLVDARWIDAPDVAPPLSDIRRVARLDGFRPALTYEGTDTLSLIALARAAHGLTLLPAWAVAAGGSSAVRITEPRIVHRVELVHGTLREASPAAVLAGLL
jgi:DNA-binding transcriptional LysR family regulator